MKNIAVILAGGKGSRMGISIPKQFIPLQDGRTVLETCVAAFHHNDHIDEIAVVMIEDYFEQAQTIIRSDNFPKVRYWIPGGKERWESSLNAIQTLLSPSNPLNSSNLLTPSTPSQEDPIVLIHDCARPFISQDLITRACDAMLTHRAATVAVPVTDTLYQVQTSCEGEVVTSVPPRTLFRRAQTPQCFRLSVLEKAFSLAMQDADRQFTDDAGVVQRYLPEVPIHIIPGEESNRKITFAEDVKQP